jgi:hypothetical protein
MVGWPLPKYFRTRRSDKPALRWLLVAKRNLCQYEVSDLGKLLKIDQAVPRHFCGGQTKGFILPNQLAEKMG